MDRLRAFEYNGLCAERLLPCKVAPCGPFYWNWACALFCRSFYGSLRDIWHGGIGRINLGTLLSEASGPLSRRDYGGLRTLSGAAPVTKRSGKSFIVVRRYAAHVRLRDTVYRWARVATQRDPKCRVRYTALRKRGHSHGRALRGVADRLLALTCVLLQRQTLFDPQFGRPIA